MTTKLHINISQGVIDVEGDPDLVREIYSDFKDQVLSGTRLAASPQEPAPDAASSRGGGGIVDSAARPKAKKRSSSKSKTNGDDGGVGAVVADSPKLDKNLNTAGLGPFYGQFSPKNNSEKILIFLKFLTDEVNVESPNTDQIYTCFKAAGEKVPKAFAQAFYDTSSKLGYIDFRSSTDIPVTIAGDNHFSHALKRKTFE